MPKITIYEYGFFLRRERYVRFPQCFRVILLEMNPAFPEMAENAFLYPCVFGTDVGHDLASLLLRKYIRHNFSLRFESYPDVFSDARYNGNGYGVADLLIQMAVGLRFWKNK